MRVGPVRTNEIEDDLLAGGGGGFLVGEEFEVDGAEGAQKLVAGVDHDGAASWGNAVLREKDEVRERGSCARPRRTGSR